MRIRGRERGKVVYCFVVFNFISLVFFDLNYFRSRSILGVGEVLSFVEGEGEGGIGGGFFSGLGWY